MKTETKIDRMNPEFQRAARGIVNAHVYMNVSSLIIELVTLESRLVADEITDLSCNLDYSSALIESGEARWDEIREQWISNDDALITLLNPYNADCWDDAQAACEALGIEPHEQETLEYWAVDSWLANQLRKQDENVVELDDLDLRVWCRTTSGQAISIDSCIEQITENVIARDGRIWLYN